MICSLVRCIKFHCARRMIRAQRNNVVARPKSTKDLSLQGWLGPHLAPYINVGTWLDHYKSFIAEDMLQTFLLTTGCECSRSYNIATTKSSVADVAPH